MSEHGHIPVLLDETLRLLAPRPGDVVVDGTLGRGGHALSLAKAISPTGHLIGFDLDQANLQYVRARLAQELPDFTNFHGFDESFVRMPHQIAQLGLRADVMLADLGFSSNQMDEASRGLSFTKESPLDMRLDPRSPITAADLLASLSERDLASLIHEYGEDPMARKIARKLAQNRLDQPIQSTTHLARLVEEAYGSKARHSRLHPATRTFMALRIAVNDELGALRSLLDAIKRGGERIEKGGWLNARARVGFICFHSLEDRLVKHAFVDLEKRDMLSRLTKRPTTADENEIRNNPRARSAKLRVARMASKDEL
ncbi:MAG: 16S rRNA (cytosine(1402)-N(4))-methyltransferase RsmH [Planctomycetota bacterium]|nr:16S rRNA (cytosine(1402)-N(4))-methyltransferase RsmH [Planctomycetota bacterium]